MSLESLRRAGGQAAVAGLCALLLGGCESGRFGGRGPVVTRSVPAETPGEPIVAAVPSAPVSVEPLGPPDGAPAPVPTMPGGPGAVDTLGGSSPPPAPAAPAARPGASRSATVGFWTARDASGASCRVNLTGNSSLDLYRASASGCANKDLARVTGWDFRDGEVYLYQPGGAVAARLRGSGNSLTGVLSKSGAPLTLTRS